MRQGEMGWRQAGLQTLASQRHPVQDAVNVSCDVHGALIARYYSHTSLHISLLAHLSRAATKVLCYLLDDLDTQDGCICVVQGTIRYALPFFLAQTLTSLRCAVTELQLNLVGHRLDLGRLQQVLHLLQTELGDPKMLHQPVINHLFILSFQITNLECYAIHRCLQTTMYCQFCCVSTGGDVTKWELHSHARSLHPRLRRTQTLLLASQQSLSGEVTMELVQKMHSLIYCGMPATPSVAQASSIADVLQVQALCIVNAIL